MLRLGQLQLIEKGGGLIDCWLNGRRICVTYEHQGNFSTCNYTKHGQASEIIIKAQKTKNLVDNFVCKINGGTSHSQTIYWNEVDSDSCPLDEEDVAEPSSNHLHPTGPFNAETVDNHDLGAFNVERAEGHGSGEPLSIALTDDLSSANSTQITKQTMTEYYGPCDNMTNMTEFILPMPESAISMFEDRFIYHDFDKIRTRQYATLYWIIDTRNYKISNFYCEDDRGILCSLNDSENKCHLQSFDDVAIYTHKLQYTAAKLGSLQCVLNDKYKGRKSVTWDHNYFPHSERTHRHH
ncbi:hypothetical protein SprV_0702339300 [Sparganum proliferum]